MLHNGALIVENGSVLRCRPLDRAVARRVIALGRAAGADPVVHAGRGGEGLLLVEGGRSRARCCATTSTSRTPTCAWCPSLAEALDDDPIQVMFGATVGEMEALRVILRDALGDAARIERTFYPHLDAGFLDVLTPGVDKAEALAFLQERWQVSAGRDAGDRRQLERPRDARGRGARPGDGQRRPAHARAGPARCCPRTTRTASPLAIERHVLGLQPA